MKVGFLATGSEIVQGEVTNTNTPALAQQLHALGFDIGWHLSVDDDPSALTAAFTLLWQRHDVVLTIGGLGPTEDDNTMATVATVLKRSLKFDEATWQNIRQFLTLRNHKIIPLNNKKQAYFPEQANILLNTVGTANGCYVTQGKKHCFVLPGPPKECFYVFEHGVLPYLQRLQPIQKQTTYYWQLLGASESVISALLEPLATKIGVQLAYCAAFPYLTIRFTPKFDNDVTRGFVHTLDQYLTPYLATKNKLTASQNLARVLSQTKMLLSWDIDTTKGFVHSQLQYLWTNQMRGKQQIRHKLVLALTGLKDFWQGTNITHDTISLSVKLWTTELPILQ